MANEKGNNKVALLGKLTFAPEARSEENSKPVIEGRFRYFFTLFKKNNNYLMVANLYFLIFCLPLLAVLIIPSIFGGMENLSYLINKVSNLPYFMSDIGIGLSSGEAVLEGRLAILRVNQLYYLGIAATLPFLAIGAAGLFHIAIKLVWQESFITKKDSYGNNVPRVTVEFFKGVKKYILPMLIIITVFALLFAAISSSFVFFTEQLWTGQAGAGEWILLIAACVIALFSVMVLIFMLPMVPMYNISMINKLKNSIILIVSMFLPVFFITVISALPFVLVSVTAGLIRVILLAALLVFGGGFYSLMWTNFVQYYADKIITPVYEAQRNKSQRKTKKKKK